MILSQCSSLSEVVANVGIFTATFAFSQSYAQVAETGAGSPPRCHVAGVRQCMLGDRKFSDDSSPSKSTNSSVARPRSPGCQFRLL